jgi:hypothetical protein
MYTETTQMAEYWIYQNHDLQYARLHYFPCIYCNNGVGRLVKPRVPGGPKVWFGFETLDGALARLRELSYPAKAVCKTCLPEFAHDTIFASALASPT